MLEFNASPDIRLGRRAFGQQPGQSKGADLVEALVSTPALAGLSRAQIAAVLSRTRQQTFRVGEVILRQNQPGSALFILREGKVRVVDEREPGRPVSLAVLKPGAVFGERSLLFGVPTNATVRSCGPVIVERLDPEGFARLLRQEPDIRTQMEQTIARYDALNFLRAIPALSQVPPSGLEGLLAHAETIEMTAGEALPDDGPHVWVLRHGTLQAAAQTAPDAAQTEGRGQWRQADMHGLHHLLRTDDPAPFGFLATSASELLRWPLEVFRDNVAPDGDLNLKITQAALAEKQRLNVLARPILEPAAADGAALRGLYPPGDTRGPARSVWRSPRPELDGLACLATAADWLGLDPQPLARLAAEPGRVAPETLVALAEMAESHALVSRVLYRPADALDGLVPPFVFVGPDGATKLALSLTRRAIRYADPRDGKIHVLGRAALAEIWSGQALGIATALDFDVAGASAASVLTRFRPLLRPYRGTVFRLVGLSLLALSVSIMLPLFTGLIVDHVLVFEDRDLLLLLLAAVLMAALMSLFAGAARSLLLVRMASCINAALMSRMFAHVLALPLAVQGKWKDGDLTLRFHENAKLFSLGQNLASVLLFDGLSVVVFSLVLFTISPLLGLLVLVLSLLSGLVMVLASSRLRAAEMACFEADRTVRAHLVETFYGIESLKLAGAEPTSSSVGTILLTQSVRADISAARLSFRLELVIEMLGTVAMLSVLGIGAAMVLGGNLTAGSLIAFVGLMAGVTGPMQNIAAGYDDLQELRIAMARVSDVLSTPVEANAGLASCPEIEGHVTFDRVSFTYGEEAGTPVLTDFSLTVPAGTRVALVGPSGSGKTTLVRMINCLLHPTGGQVRVDGLDIAQLEPMSLRRQIGVVGQVPHIFAGSIRENIAMGQPDMPHSQVVAAARAAGAAQFIEALPLGYATRIGEGGRTLSGGQAQRISIARAIVTDPRILILDEATAALDNETELLVQHSLDAVSAGRTVFAVAHRLSTIRDYDMIVVLDRGKIVEKGNHAQLVALGGLYAEMLTASESDGHDHSHDADDPAAPELSQAASAMRAL